MARLLNVGEVAERYNVQKQQIYRWVHAGRIPYTRIGKYYLFDPAKIEEWDAERSYGVKAG